MTPELSRPVAADRIGGSGLTVAVDGTARECEAVAARLRIPAVRSLHCRFTLTRGGDGARGEVVGEGDLCAVVVQTCVVSGEDFPADIRERFRVRFVRAGTETDTDIDEDDEIPYEAGVIDLGEATVEQLALNLDPAPRKPGAELPPEAQADEAPDGPASPFAALAGRLQKN